MNLKRKRGKKLEFKTGAILNSIDLKLVGCRSICHDQIRRRPLGVSHSRAMIWNGNLKHLSSPLKILVSVMAAAPNTRAGRRSWTMALDHSESL